MGETIDSTSVEPDVLDEIMRYFMSVGVLRRHAMQYVLRRRGELRRELVEIDRVIHRMEAAGVVHEPPEVE